MSCFTADGSPESRIIGKYEGQAGIRAFSERFEAMHLRGVQLRHVLTNLAAVVEGGRAHAACYLANILTWAGKSQLGRPGRYECEPRRRRLVVPLPSGRAGRGISAAGDLTGLTTSRT